MNKYVVLSCISLSCFCFGQLKIQENQFVMKDGLYSSVNKSLNLSKQQILISNNYFRKDINYFSSDNPFQSKQEKLKQDIQKPLVASLLEGVVSGILNNKKNNK
ncbi:MAG: hypothetical protein KA232_01545 [Chryseobacterium sp.]|nr:hypothetical protein [Chryseobacterium sp.]